MSARAINSNLSRFDTCKNSLSLIFQSNLLEVQHLHDNKNAKSGTGNFLKSPSFIIFKAPCIPSLKPAELQP